MIPVSIRILATALSCGYLALIVHSLLRSRMNVRQSLLWLSSGLLSLAISVFPELLLWAGFSLHFAAPSNALFLVWSLTLTLLIFSQSLTTCRQDEQIRQLAQALAIARLEAQQRQESTKPAADPATAWNSEEP